MPIPSDNSDGSEEEHWLDFEWNPLKFTGLCDFQVVTRNARGKGARHVKTNPARKDVNEEPGSSWMDSTCAPSHGVKENTRTDHGNSEENGEWGTAEAQHPRTRTPQRKIGENEKFDEVKNTPNHACDDTC